MQKLWFLHAACGLIYMKFCEDILKGLQVREQTQFCDRQTPQGKPMRIYHECEGRIEKSVLRMTDWHLKASRLMTKGDREWHIFLSHPHTNNGFFFLLTTKYFIFIGKH